MMFTTTDTQSLQDRITSMPKAAQRLINQKLRKKAIERATERIKSAGKNYNDFSESELEVIVKEEEDKLISELKDYGFKALAIFLGIDIITDFIFI